MEKQEDTHAEKKRIDDSTRAQQSHTGCAVSSTCTSFVQCSLSTKAAALSPCWAWKPVPHSVSQDVGDQSVTFSNTISFQDNFSFVQFLFLMPQLKNASKHSGKFWMIALILGGVLMFDYPGTLCCGAGSLCSLQCSCAALGQYRSADRFSAAMSGMLLWAKRNLKVALENFT